MKNKLAFFVVLLAIGAFAASEPIYELVSTLRPTWFQSGIYVGNRVTGPVNSTINKVSAALGADIDFDFATATTTCEDSPNFALVGSKIGDPCFVGVRNLGTDGGAGKNALFSCNVFSTDTVSLRHCPAGTADDPPDAAFCVRILSHQ